MVEWAAGLVKPQLAERPIQQTVWMMAGLQYGPLVLQVGWLVVVQLAEAELLRAASAKSRQPELK